MFSQVRHRLLQHSHSNILSSLPFFFFSNADLSTKVEKNKIKQVLTVSQETPALQSCERRHHVTLILLGFHICSCLSCSLLIFAFPFTHFQEPCVFASLHNPRCTSVSAFPRHISCSKESLTSYFSSSSR